MFRQLKESFRTSSNKSSASILPDPFTDLVQSPTIEFTSFCKKCDSFEILEFIQGCLSIEKQESKKRKLPSLQRFTDPTNFYEQINPTDVQLNLVTDYLKVYSRFIIQNAPLQVSFPSNLKENVELNLKEGAMVKFKNDLFEKCIDFGLQRLRQVYEEFNELSDTDHDAPEKTCRLQFIRSLWDVDFEMFCKGSDGMACLVFLKAITVLESTLDESQKSTLRFSTMNQVKTKSNTVLLAFQKQSAYEAIYSNWILNLHPFLSEIDESILEEIVTFMNALHIEYKTKRSNLTQPKESKTPRKSVVSVFYEIPANVFHRLIDYAFGFLFTRFFIDFQREEETLKFIKSKKKGNRASFMNVYTIIQPNTQRRDFVNAVIQPDDGFAKLIKTCKLTGCFEFLNSIIILEKESVEFRRSTGFKPPNKEYFPLMNRFVGIYDGVVSCEVPSTLVSEYMGLYNLYLSNNAPCKLSINTITLSTLDTKLNDKNAKLNTNAFDTVIDELLSLLFEKLFIPYTDGDRIDDTTFQNFVINQSDDTTPAIKSSRRSSMIRKGDESGKANFIKILSDASTYKAFIMVAKEDVCHENILFYDKYLALEEIHGDYLAKWYPMTKFAPLFERFMTSEKSDTLQLVPLSLVAHYCAFNAEFIVNNAEHEVNITEKKKNLISEVLSCGPTKIPFTIYDDAADSVLLLLYQNTFKKYLAKERLKR